MMKNVKTNMPSIRDLRDAVSKEKKTMSRADTQLFIRVRVYGDRWVLDSGHSQFFVDHDPAVLVAAHDVVEHVSSSQVVAKGLVAKLKEELLAEPSAVTEEQPVIQEVAEAGHAGA